MVPQRTGASRAWYIADRPGALPENKPGLDYAESTGSQRTWGKHASSSLRWHRVHRALEVYDITTD